MRWILVMVAVASAAACLGGCKNNGPNGEPPQAASSDSGAAGFISDRGSEVTQPPLKLPAGREATDLERRLAEHLEKAYARVLQEVLEYATPEQRAAMLEVKGPIVDPLLNGLTDIFVEPQGASPRRIVIGLGGALWCDSISKAWLVDISLDEPSPDFAENYFKYVRSQLASDGSAVAPYEAAGWDADKLTAGQKEARRVIANSIAFFIVAHEVGHVVLGHKSGLNAASSQLQEKNADAFACRLAMKREQKYPGAMTFSGIGILLHSCALAFEQSPNFEATHPPNWDRVIAAAKILLAEAKLSDQERASIESIVKSGELLIADPDALTAFENDARGVTVESLRRPQPTTTGFDRILDAKKGKP